MDLQEIITSDVLPLLGTKFRFAAVDLAPNDQLESGFSVIDRDRNIIRMEKLYKNEDIIAAILNLGPPGGTIVVVDMPKSLSIQGRWRQEEVKMHALRLEREGRKISRYEGRGPRLYQALQAKGLMTFLYFNYWARLNYEMLLPYRSRSPQGCRALQIAIEHRLGLKNMPGNLAPSSVLESLIGTYVAWSLWAGKPDRDYDIYKYQNDYRVIIPRQKPHVGMPIRRARRFKGKLQIRPTTTT